MYNVAEIKEKADLRTIVSDAGIKLRHNRACCPFHEEKTASFFVHSGGKYYKCFGCGAGGDVISFVSKFYNVNFNGAVRLLAERYGTGELSVAESIRLKAERKKRAVFDEWKEDTIKMLTELFRDMHFYILRNKPELSIVDVTDKYLFAVNYIDLIELYLNEITRDSTKFYKTYGESEVQTIAGKWNNI